MGDGDEEEAELRCLSAVETVASGKGGRGEKMKRKGRLMEEAKRRRG